MKNTFLNMFLLMKQMKQWFKIAVTEPLLDALCIQS